MARVRKPQPTLDSLVFATPEQKVLKLLLSEPTTAFSPRVISSKLKGVRGLGGSDGIQRILTELETLGLVDFVDNRRSVRLHDENSAAHVLKTFLAICDLEGLAGLLTSISSRGVLFGSRARGRGRSDSDYDLFVVSDQPDEVRRICGSHPLGKMIEVVVWTADEYENLEKNDPRLHEKLHSVGIVLWGPSW